MVKSCPEEKVVVEVPALPFCLLGPTGSLEMAVSQLLRGLSLTQLRILNDIGVSEVICAALGGCSEFLDGFDHATLTWLLEAALEFGEKSDSVPLVFFIEQGFVRVFELSV
jgi:hypothetical protein